MGGGDHLAEGEAAAAGRCRLSGAGRALGEPGVGERAAAGLARLTAALPDGEVRPGQVAMAEAVARAMEERRHLLVQAGTGTGKSLAYLVPCVLSGRRCVVVTATKALQEQLTAKDLPLLEAALGVPFRAALLKGRSNYLCLAALEDAERGGGDGQGSLLDPGHDRGRLAGVRAWAAAAVTGDRSDLPWAVADREWAAVSVGWGECPGAARCSHGEGCFAERARAGAAEADVVVVNTYLYGLHLASGGVVLPPHEVVVIDEAHALEDIAAQALGATVGPGRLRHLAAACRRLLAGDHPAPDRLDTVASHLEAALAPLVGRRVDPAGGELATVLVGCAEAAAAAGSAARCLDAGEDVGTRVERVVQLVGGVVGDVRALGEGGDRHVTWVEDGGRGGGAVPSPVLRTAPVDVGESLAATLFAERTVVLTSATLTVGGRFEPIAARVGLDRLATATAGEDRPAPPWWSLDVGSPFDYQGHALLYCAAHLPDPRSPGFEAAVTAEMEGLVRAAGGRTLALFTSRRAMEAAAQRLERNLPFPVLVQDALPRPRLRRAFLGEESSVLLATMSFWQGFDAPGPTCSLVVVDRLPFSRPDDPLVQARREVAARSGRDPFATVDLPRAAVLLAQGVGRLIRAGDDRGVVAVLDRRLATAPYRWTLVRSLPPMRRTRDPAEVRAVLAGLARARDGSSAAGGEADRP
ncbi:MAG: ATP-dependent DNA helicase [Acidimicrobiales bacterium]